MTLDGRRLCTEELNDLYQSPIVIRALKSGRVGWIGHVAHMGETSGACRELVAKPEGRSLTEDLALGGIILKWVFNICD